MQLFISNNSWKFETDTVITFLFTHTDHGMGVLWLALVVISMRLPDSASIVTAENCALVKALEQIKDSIASKYMFRLTFLSLSFTIYKAGTSLDWDDDTKAWLFKFC